MFYLNLICFSFCYFSSTTHLKCFVKMLNELKDIAGQHELVAENIEDRIIIRLNQMTKSLKEERRKVSEFYFFFYNWEGVLFQRSKRNLTFVGLLYFFFCFV